MLDFKGVKLSFCLENILSTKVLAELLEVDSGRHDDDLGYVLGLRQTRSRLSKP